MNWIATLLIPNFNWTAIIGAIVLVFGIIGFYLSGYLPKRLKSNGRAISVIMLLVGFAYWMAVSVTQDLLKDTKMLAVVVVIIFIAIFGALMFWQPKKKLKR